MAVKFFGPSWLLTSVKTERDPVKGFTTTYIYEGESLAIYGLARKVRSNQRYAIDDSDKPLFRLTVQSPDAGVMDAVSDYVLQFELLGNDVELSLYEHPTSRDLGDTVLTAVKVAVKAVEDVAVTEAAAEVAKQITEIRSVAIGEHIGDGQTYADRTEALFRLLLKGTTSFVTSQFVLRRTQTVSSPIQILINYEEVDRIHSAAVVAQLEQLTLAIYLAIGSIPEPTAQSGYAWGWLKKSPTVNAVSNGKYTITQEYWLAQWSTYIYGDLISSLA